MSKKVNCDDIVFEDKHVKDIETDFLKKCNINDLRCLVKENNLQEKNKN